MLDKNKKDLLIETIDGSYFIPNEFCTYENRGDNYEVIIVCGQGAGFYKEITKENMEKIIKNYE